ncbi:hypothetical protein C0J52_26393 [Blattella germanica]|nr:hypothetical protein C0J52_26393 [Blattella germanica]
MSTGHEPKYLSWLDYVVFAIMLFLSALIGIYFAFFAKKKQNTTSEYLMGGKTMGIFPISMSLIASYISGISLLGLPAEMYVYGTQYSMIMCPEVFVSVTMAFVYLPVFYKLQITSSYEMLYIPIVIYVPALAFSQVTGANLHLITPIVCLVCIFYTTLGGLKAVVWTDTLQTILMFGGVIVVMILGTMKVGGIGVVWELSKESERLEFFNLDPDPTIRHTFWNVAFGNYFHWLASCSVNQAMVQRCLAMPSIQKANVGLSLEVYVVSFYWHGYQLEVKWPLQKVKSSFLPNPFQWKDATYKCLQMQHYQFLRKYFRHIIVIQSTRRLNQILFMSGKFVSCFQFRTRQFLQG